MWKITGCYNLLDDDALLFTVHFVFDHITYETRTALCVVWN